MLPGVSPVIVGAEAASPQPMMPSLVSMRASTFSALRTSSNDIFTGLIIGRLMAMACTRWIRMVVIPIKKAAPQRRIYINKIK